MRRPNLPDEWDGVVVVIALALIVAVGMLLGGIFSHWGTR